MKEELDWKLIGFTDGKSIEPVGPGDLPIPTEVLGQLEAGAEVDPADEVARRRG